MSSRPESKSVMPSPFAWAAATAIVFAGLLVYERLLGFYFTDVDTFTLIATSRFRDLEGLVEVLTSPMMKGQLPNALFFRPFSSLTWAFDEWVWGMNPLGFHLTDLTIHLVNSVLVFVLVGRIATRDDGLPEVESGSDAPAISRRQIEALLAALLFCLHPIAVEAVAAIARRPDLLFGGFSLLALLATQRRLRTGAERDSLWVALACVMALASKDSAVVVLAMVGLYVLFFAKASGIIERIWIGIRVGWIPLLGVLVYVGLRGLVLGGMGGYTGSFEQSMGSVVKSSAHVFSCAAVMPGQLDDCEPRLALLLASGVALVGAALAVVWLRSGEGRALRRVSFALSCVMLFFALYAATKTVALTRTIYALLPYFSMLLAWGLVGSFSGLYRAARERRFEVIPNGVRFASATVTALLTAGLLQGAVGGAYLEEWRIIGERVRRLITSVEASVHDIVPGSRVYTVNVPFKISPGPDRLRDHPLLDDYSIQSWVDLSQPLRKLDVVCITRVRIGSSRPTDVASLIEFDPAAKKFDIQVGVRARVEVCETQGLRSDDYPIRDARQNVNFVRQRLWINLEPDAFSKPPIAFWVYSGGELHLRQLEPWQIEHKGAIGEVTLESEG